MRDIDLDIAAAPKYEAVSYSWRKDILRSSDELSGWFPDKFPLYGKQDSSAKPKFILCNERHMRIQANLYDFLVRLRVKKRRLPLWIDAICIDQDEDDEDIRREKIRQLEMMGKIYRHAETVLVWLGETDNISLGFARALEKVQPVQVDYEPYETEYDIWNIHKKTRPLRMVHELTGPTIESLTRLLNRDYFQRAWVVQELVLARELVFFLGSIELPPDKLLNGIRIITACGAFLYDKLENPSDVAGSGFRAIPHMLKAQKDGIDPELWSLRDFLFLCRDREASRPEDKVFSVLGLINSAEQERLMNGVDVTDGEALVTQLYANCGTYLAEEKGWPYLLTLVAMGAADSDLPSWIPDLRVRLQPKPFWYYGCTHFTAATSEHGEFSVTRPGTSTSTSAPWSLILRAAHIDEIVQVGESHGEILTTQVKYAKGHILDLMTKLGKFYAGTDELSMDAVMRTLTAAVFERDGKIPLAKLRRAFLGWFGLIIRNMRFEPAKSRPEDSLFRGTARGRHAVALHDTGRINGTEVEIEEVVRTFLDVHDSPEYPWVKRLGNPPPVILAGEELVGVDVVERIKGGRRRLVNEFESDTPEHFWRFMEQQIGGVAWAFNEIYQQRRVFRTKDRNMVGIGPRDLRRGDRICLVAGCPTPFIFRHSSTGTAAGMQAAKLVGSAYLHGAMYGALSRDTSIVYEPLCVV